MESKTTRISTSGNRSVVLKSERQHGQVVVEYVLLLSIAVALALIVVTGLVKRDDQDPENSGALIRQWQRLQNQIAEDVPP